MQRPFQVLIGVLLLLGLVGACGSDSGRSTPVDEVETTTTKAEVVPSTTATQDSSVSPDSQESLEVVDTAIKKLLDDFAASQSGGVDVLVQRNGDLRRAAAGDANVAGDPLYTGQPFRVGSISKPFVATMVLQLVDEGKVELDKSIGTYLQAVPVAAVATATIRELLSHRSGIANYTEQPQFFSTVLAEPGRRFTPDEIVGLVADAPAKTPGAFAYSNTNYILLGQLIEHFDGTSLNDSLEARIAGPLGLINTFFAAADQPAPDAMAAGWSPGILDGQADAEYTAVATSAWAAGALISTTDDLATFLAGLFGGELITNESLEQMTDTGSGGYGLGIFAVAFGPSQTGFGHNGSIPGYTSTMAFDPATGDTLVILTNNDRLVADQLAPQLLTAS